MQIKVSLDWEGFQEKPSSSKQYKDFNDRRGKPLTEALILGSRLGKKVVNIELGTFALKIAKDGHTWSPFVFTECPETGKIRRREDLFQSCQVLGLDFDGGIDLEGILQRCEEHNLKPNIIHQTFSSKPEHLKYRTIFVLDRVYTNVFEVRLKIKKLLKLFPEADPVAKDVARLYYGSNKGFEHLDANNINEIIIDDSERIEEEEKTIREVERMKNNSGDGFKYGDMQDQTEVIKELTPEQIEFIRKRMEFFTKQIILFKGASLKGDKISRYELIFDAAEKLTGLKGLRGSYIKYCLTDAIARNAYFKDWGYDPGEVIDTAMVWKSKKPDIASGFEFDIVEYRKGKIGSR